jgi:hypothetical protein
LIPVSKGVEKLKFSISDANNLGGWGLAEIICFISAFINCIGFGKAETQGKKIPAGCSLNRRVFLQLKS